MSLKELERILTPEMRSSNTPLKMTSEWESLFKIKKGLFRIPDVTKIRNLTLKVTPAFQQAKIDDIIEIKFNEIKDEM